MSKKNNNSSPAAFNGDAHGELYSPEYALRINTAEEEENTRGDQQHHNNTTAIHTTHSVVRTYDPASHIVRLVQFTSFNVIYEFLYKCIVYQIQFDYKYN